MKRWLKWIGAGLALLISAPILFVLSGYLLPSEVVLETDRRVDVPPEAVYELVSSYDGLQKWWGQANIAMGESFDVMHLDGPKEGAGMHVGFGRDGQVLESWTYTEADAPNRVAMDVDFTIFISHRSLELKPDGDGTHIYWKEVAQVDGPHWRWMLKFFTKSAIENRQIVMGATEEASRQ